MKEKRKTLAYPAQHHLYDSQMAMIYTSVANNVSKEGLMKEFEDTSKKVRDEAELHIDAAIDNILEVKKKYGIKIKPIWKEVVHNHTQEDFTYEGERLHHIDAYLVGNDSDEDGRCIATVDENGVVVYNDNRAKSDKNAQELISLVRHNALLEKEEVIKKTIERLKKDIESEDVTAITEMLMSCDIKAMQSFLPE